MEQTLKIEEFQHPPKLPVKFRGRSVLEKIFLVLFVPFITLMYVILKYPHWLVENPEIFRLFGKNPSFWYSALYTGIVCGIALWVLLKSQNPYQTSKKKTPLSSYQRGKFTSIFFVQLFAFFLIPYVLLPYFQNKDFFNDEYKLASKNAHVYVSPGFMSGGMALYLFVVIPLATWFFGKRYCTWFCACGNLAETVGVTKWGNSWVMQKTPRGKTAQKLEVIQTLCLLFAFVFGFILFLDGLKLLSARNLVDGLQATQDLIIDFLFGSMVGVLAYPFLGNRVWCRYGCPLAKGMQWVGFLKSRFKVVANENCKGLGLCTQACPMGIDVMAYAYDTSEKKPKKASFSIPQTPCIGCGGCIEICPVHALSFEPLRGGKKEASGE
jgi:ferredoxin-type protein NapH